MAIVLFFVALFIKIITSISSLILIYKIKNNHSDLYDLYLSQKLPIILQLLLLRVDAEELYDFIEQSDDPATMKYIVYVKIHNYLYKAIGVCFVVSIALVIMDYIFR
jgi:hypothetical protein